MKDKWLNDIKDKLSGYEMEVPEGLWESIQRAPNADEVKDRKRRNPFWHRAAAVAAAAAIVLLCGWQLWRLSDNVDNLQPEVYAEIAEDKSSNIVESSSLEQSSIAQVVETKHSRENRITTSPGIREQNHQQLNVEESVVRITNTNDLIDDADRNEESPSLDNNDKASEDTYVEVKNLSIYKGDGDDYVSWNSSNQFSKSKRLKGTNNRLTLGVVTTASSAVGINGNDAVTDDRYATATPIDSIFKDDGSYATDDMTTRSITSSSRYIPDSDRDEISHHMPLKVGLTFMYRFNKVLALETGILYSNLKSDIKYNGSSTLFRDARQSLHYLGIPVNLKYTPVSWKRLNVYLSGGFSFEKCIYGNLKGNLRTQNSVSAYVETIGIHEHPFQVSANVGAGLQFAITNFCGIYAEPTVGYYFDDGSSLCTIYKNHPWNFNINVGLRFSIGK